MPFLATSEICAACQVRDRRAERDSETSRHDPQERRDPFEGSEPDPRNDDQRDGECYVGGRLAPTIEAPRIFESTVKNTQQDKAQNHEAHDHHDRGGEASIDLLGIPAEPLQPVRSVAVQ